MAKELSRAEQDRLRRKGGKAGPGRRRAWVAAGAVAVVGLVVWAVVANSGTPEGRASNMAAFGLEDDPYMGDPDADVVVVGFEAPRCSACRGFHAQTLPSLKLEFFDTGQAVFYYVQYRISNDDFDIGIMQECAFRHGGQAGFWTFTDKIYLELGQYPSIQDAEGKLRDYSRQAENEDAVMGCYEGRDTASKVSSDWNVGDDWDVRGTPTFYVFSDGKAIQASSNQLAPVIRELHEQAVADA